MCCPHALRGGGPWGCSVSTTLGAGWQPAWRVLVVFLRTPLCFQLICFDISSRQEVLCVGVCGSAMWHLNHAKQEHTFRFPWCFKEMWFPLCCKERVDLIATLCGDLLWCPRIRDLILGKKKGDETFEAFELQSSELRCSLVPMGHSEKSFDWPIYHEIRCCSKIKIKICVKSKYQQI